MRSRLNAVFAIAILSLALGSIAFLPSRGEASPKATGVSPMWALSVTRQATDTEQAAPAADAQPDQVQNPVRPTLGLDATRASVADGSIALRVASLQKQNDDRELAGARTAVAELRQETIAIAETTVESAITNYRETDLEAGLFELENLNAGIRANALADAAIIADTDTFDEYRDKIKDLELALRNLDAEEAENAVLSAEVSELSDRLATEQSWLAELEERELHTSTRGESIEAAVWSQNLGRKQGFYLQKCPVFGDHNFIDSWGFPRSGGRRHKGVDILADIGTPIQAPVSGRVEFRSNRVGGRSFHLWDDKGNYFYGTHLSAYGDTEGDVLAGQVIGYVGDDGNAAGIPHLHFEIHAGGRGNQINPYIDSASVCSGAQ